MWAFYCSNVVNWKTLFLSCWFTNLRSSQVKSENGPCAQRARRNQGKKQAPPVGRRQFNKKNWHTRLVLGSPQMSRSSHLSARILKVCIAALPGFSHIDHPDGLYDTLLSLKAVSLETVARVGRMYILRMGREIGEKPWITQTQLKSQPAVMSSWWLPPTIFNFTITA